MNLQLIKILAKKAFNYESKTEFTNSKELGGTLVITPQLSDGDRKI